MKDFDPKTYDYNLLVDIFAGHQLCFDGPIYISEENAARAALEGIRQRKTLNESRNSILSYIKDCQIAAEQKNMELAQVVDEGFLGALLGGITGATIGPQTDLFMRMLMKEVSPL